MRKENIFSYRMVLFSLKFAPRCESYFGLVPMIAQPVIRESNQSGVIVKIALRHDRGINLNWGKSSLKETHCGGYVPLPYPVSVSWSCHAVERDCRGRQSFMTAASKKHLARTIIQQQWTPKLNKRDLFLHNFHDLSTVVQLTSGLVTGNVFSPTKLHLECPFMLG